MGLTISGGSPPYTTSWGTSEIHNLYQGIYSVTVTDHYGCTASLFEQEVKAAPLIELDDSVVQVSCPGNDNGEIHLTVSGGESPYSYRWNNSATTVNITGLIVGIYAVTVTDKNGCIATATRQLDTCQSARMESPPDTSDDEVSIYPNPANSEIKITYRIIENGKLEIKDLTGRIIKKFYLNKEDHLHTYNIQDISQGVYICYVNSGNRKIKAIKIVIIKELKH